MDEIGTATSTGRNHGTWNFATTAWEEHSYRTPAAHPQHTLKSERVTRAYLDGYIDRTTEHYIHEQGRTMSNRAALRRWMAAYAAAVSTTAPFETIRDAASLGEADKPGKATTIAYRAALEGLWMIEDVPAWLPTRNHLRRLASTPAHQLADPALDGLFQGVLVSGRRL